MLKTYRSGPETGTPLLIVHGLFGSARNWTAITRRLATTRPVIGVDMRNHGESPWQPTQSYEDMAGDLAEVIAATGGPADVLGHSMGGKAAMVLALTRPDLVRRLIVADISPVTYGHTQMPLIEAMQRLDLSDLKTRSEADRRLAAEVDEPAVRAFLLQSLDMKATPPRWRLNLKVLASDMEKILGFPKVSGSFEGPVLVVSGGNSDYVQAAHRAETTALFPRARFVKIPGAGHWIHAEKPQEFAATVAAWLDQAA
ncbi:alpha/beta fold hydrolase [Tropicimonas sp. IMCC34043]|uniref:alpha/beta fold hydrolase n=1 Tax=Tropicimonas sp. IMCC34043 TaxID=2248760 RepID=UPI000E266470|nr:alpha/beta fold hydrolase [Tropicimonas sp. IMCC34043]